MKYVDKFNTDLIIGVLILEKGFEKVVFSNYDRCTCRFFTDKCSKKHIDCTYDKATGVYHNLKEDATGQCFALINADDLKCLPNGELMMEFLFSIPCSEMDDNYYDGTYICSTDIYLDTIN
jgi:hypothetical protein